jgi:hypothetical protein
VPKTESSPHKEVLIGGDNNPSRRFLYFCWIQSVWIEISITVGAAYCNHG